MEHEKTDTISYQEAINIVMRLFRQRTGQSVIFSLAADRKDDQFVVRKSSEDDMKDIVSRLFLTTTVIGDDELFSELVDVARDLEE